jgi:RNA polymerase sigma factor (sigma-70 family)
LSESQIITQCQKADKRAQQLLYAQYADGMLRLALRYVKSQPDAEDTLIIAFTKVFKSIRNFNYQGDGSLVGWIRKIVVNESLMLLRKKHNFNLTESLDEALPEPDLTSFSELNAEDILLMIAQLPTGYRTVFNLSVIEGYTHDEIAVLLSIKEATSRSQLFKAKALLKKMLLKEGYYYGT